MIWILMTLILILWISMMRVLMTTVLQKEATEEEGAEMQVVKLKGDQLCIYGIDA